MTPSAVAHRTENLALVLQEALTAIVRLRSNRQAVSDAGSFRIHMREALKSADQEARKLGYSGDVMQLATFAVVAFLDESILNSRNPMFADWPRKPLQEELFGTHMAGEVFFQNLQKLLGQTDSPELADQRCSSPPPPGSTGHWLDWRRSHQARSRWYHQRTRLARDAAIVLAS